MRRVLVIRFSSLGDVILTFSALAQLAQEGCEVHFLTKEAFRPLVSFNSHVFRIHTISNRASFSELRQKTQELKQFQFDHVYDLHRNIRSWAASFLLGVPKSRIWKHRFKEFFLYFFHHRIFGLVRLSPIGRAAEAQNLVRGTSSRSASRSVIQIEQHHESVQSLVMRFPKGYVCVAIESAWIEKEWPAERFIEIAKRLALSETGVVWIGLRALPSQAQLEGAVDLTGKLTIKEVASVLSRARMLLSNDSGLMHLSEAVGTPVTAIFGPTTRELGFAPSLSSSQIAEVDLWCRPCSKTGRWCIRPIERRKCLTELTTDSVWSVVKSVLAKSEQKEQVKD